MGLFSSLSGEAGSITFCVSPSPLPGGDPSVNEQLDV
jgi:hypothetical protein